MSKFVVKIKGLKPVTVEALSASSAIADVLNKKRLHYRDVHVTAEPVKTIDPAQVALAA